MRLLLEEKDLVINAKYCPLSKEGVYPALHNSIAYQTAIKKGQPYLYYTGKNQFGCLAFDYKERTMGSIITGDYFYASEMVRYVEPDAEIFTMEDMIVFADVLVNAILHNTVIEMDREPFLSTIRNIAANKITELKAKWI